MDKQKQISELRDLLYGYWNSDIVIGDKYEVISKALVNIGYHKEKTCIYKEWQDCMEQYVWNCSNCNEDFCFIEGSAKENMYQYCPCCGARITEYKELQE